MPVHPKRRAAGGVAGLAMASTLLIAGCVGPADAPPSPPPPAAAPVFASDEDALAAAEAAYAEYLAMLDVAYATYDLSGVERVATSGALEQARSAVERLGSDRLKYVGESHLVIIELSQADLSSGTVSVETCVDLSETDVVDESGQSVAATSRDVAAAFNAELEWSVEVRMLVVVSDIPFATGDECAPH